MNLKKNLEKNKALIREALVSFTTIIVLTTIVAVISYISTRPVAEIIRNSIPAQAPHLPVFSSDPIQLTLYISPY